MPELPEVETIRRGLKKNLVGKTIKSARIFDKKIISGQKGFEREVAGKKIAGIGRVGKLLVINLSPPPMRRYGDESNFFLIIHLKMTGQLILRHDHKITAGGHNLPRLKESDLPLKYTRAIFEFQNGSTLYFNDLRRFAYMKVVDERERDRIYNNYGPDPTKSDFTLGVFKKLIKNRPATAGLKALLINQKAIAGIGNIYADEICFKAGLLPNRSAASLSDKEIAKLFRAIKFILKHAISHKGTTFKDFKDAEGKKGGHAVFLNVYGREGKKCLRCKTGTIVKKRMAGRGTSYCDSCQN